MEGEIILGNVEDKCPNCMLNQTGDYLAQSANLMGLGPSTKAKYCFECSCIFVAFDFIETSVEAVNMQ